MEWVSALLEEYGAFVLSLGPRNPQAVHLLWLPRFGEPDLLAKPGFAGQTGLAGEAGLAGQTGCAG